jgi:hypothetical protein
MTALLSLRAWRAIEGSGLEKEFVSSKGINWIRYDAANRALDVAYASAKTYRYFDVPRSVYEWLMKARSKGRFVNRLVQSNYRFEQIEQEPAAPSDRDLERLLKDSLNPRVE